MNADNRNLIAAIAISMMILIVYQIYFLPPENTTAEYCFTGTDPGPGPADSGILPASGKAVLKAPARHRKQPRG